MQCQEGLIVAQTQRFLPPRNQLKRKASKVCLTQIAQGMELGLSRREVQRKWQGDRKNASWKRQVDSRGPHTQQQQQLNREEKVNVNDGTNQELFPLIPPGFKSICNGQGLPPPGFKSICNGQGLLDGEKVDERPIQLHIQDAGGSQCTMENTALRSCSAVGTSLHPPFLSCQISGERFPFIKTSSIWHQIEPMEVFRKVPQEPHFLPLQQFMPELREGMAIGLMVTYASLVESVKRSCIEDNIELFERKINALAHLEENGFDVKLLQHSLMKLLEAKWEHTKHLGHLDELKELVPRKESAMSHKHALLVEKEGAIFQLEQKLECLRGEAEQIARETKDEDAELLRLKEGVNIAQEACVNVEVRFHDILADMRSRLQLSE
ncbi:unnamed protein product [Triticum turgidum subsp. durum]|uniref:Uncharacterized protein n=1 Tax=Triticum turgidum subsp. durum TaxID=4567 RepID=A0A9R0WCD7_TRITD|nr:unnamed protein product [Triticum turgidum subsp. durum]